MDTTISHEDPQKQPHSNTKAYRAQKAREWRAAHKEIVSQRNRAYSDANKERLVQYRKSRYAANREQFNQKNRERYQQNREARCQSYKTYYYTHPEQIKARRQANKERRRITNLARRYGISAGEWDALYQQQNGCCAICGKYLNGNIDTKVDHCHETGVVRGLLCHNCNIGIGMLGDSPDVALRAHQYLSQWSIVIQILK